MDLALEVRAVGKPVARSLGRPDPNARGRARIQSGSRWRIGCTAVTSMIEDLALEEQEQIEGGIDCTPPPIDGGVTFPWPPLQPGCF